MDYKLNKQQWIVSSCTGLYIWCTSCQIKETSLDLCPSITAVRQRWRPALQTSCSRRHLSCHIVAKGNYKRPVGSKGEGFQAPWSHISVTLQRPAASRWPLAAVVHLLHGSAAQAALGLRAHVAPCAPSLNKCCYSPPAAYCWVHTLPNRWLLQCRVGGQKSHPLE